MGHVSTMLRWHGSCPPNTRTMITDYLLLGPGGELLCSRGEIWRYVELYYDDRQPCLRCGCYLIPTRRSRGFLFRTYRCANSICSASRRMLRLPLQDGRAA